MRTVAVIFNGGNTAHQIELMAIIASLFRIVKLNQQLAGSFVRTDTRETAVEVGLREHIAFSRMPLKKQLAYFGQPVSHFGIRDTCFVRRPYGFFI